MKSHEGEFLGLNIGEIITFVTIELKMKDESPVIYKHMRNVVVTLLWPDRIIMTFKSLFNISCFDFI